MKKYWFIALIALAAGCKTTGHHEAYEHRPARMAGMDGVGIVPGTKPGWTPVVIYYHEASQRLAESRRDGWLSNDKYAELLEKLQADIRQIMMVEAESVRPAHAMPMMHPPMGPAHPMPMRPPRHEREDD